MLNITFWSFPFRLPSLALPSLLHSLFLIMHFWTFHSLAPLICISPPEGRGTRAHSWGIPLHPSTAFIQRVVDSGRIRAFEKLIEKHKHSTTLQRGISLQKYSTKNFWKFTFVAPVRAFAQRFSSLLEFEKREDETCQKKTLLSILRKKCHCVLFLCGRTKIQELRGKNTYIILEWSGWFLCLHLGINNNIIILFFVIIKYKWLTYLW